MVLMITEVPFTEYSYPPILSTHRVNPVSQHKKPEAAVPRCSSKYVFLKILQYSKQITVTGFEGTTT